ncbi:MAG: hypothetical protein QS98_C0008G0019 [archaeon GW2011_AR3]|nr:MAG: hypothetical protein QS98_C0008G0019 [archaeon GW2011_AR3]
MKNAVKMKQGKGKKGNKVNIQLLIISLMLALIATPVMADVIDSAGNFFGRFMSFTSRGASSTAGIYDTYAEFFDFVIFTLIFIAVLQIALNRVWGEDFKKAGAGNAIRGLVIILGIAFGIAAIKAGLTVSFFIPFVRNLLYFLAVIVIYFLLLRMGVKSKILAFILAIIIAIILFNLGDMIFTGKLGKGLPSIGKNTFKLPDLGGVTSTVSSAVNSAGNFVSGIFSSTHDASHDNTKILAERENAWNAEIEKYKQRARVECRVDIKAEDSPQEALRKLQNANQALINWLNDPKVPEEGKASGRSRLEWCSALAKEFSGKLDDMAAKKKLILEGKTVPQESIPTYSGDEIDRQLASVAYYIKKDCEFADISNSDTYQQMLDKLSASTAYYRSQIAYGVAGMNVQVEDEKLSRCERHLSKLSQLLIQYSNKEKATETARFQLGCSAQVLPGAPAEQAYIIVGKYIAQLETNIRNKKVANLAEANTELSECNKWLMELDAKRKAEAETATGKGALIPGDLRNRLAVNCGIIISGSETASELKQEISTVKARPDISSECAAAIADLEKELGIGLAEDELASRRIDCITEANRLEVAKKSVAQKIALMYDLRQYYETGIADCPSIT